MKLLKSILAVAFIFTWHVASAHTELTSSTPADNATVPAPVKQIVLEFEEPVRLTALSLVDSMGAEKSLPAVPGETAAQFTIPVQVELSPGDYVATWRAVGDDGHMVAGQIHFTVSTGQ